MYLLLFVLFLTLAVLLYRNEQRKFKGIEGIPGPITIPFLGNSLSFGFSVIDFFQTINRLHEKYGLVVRLWPVWLKPSVMVADPEVIEFVLSSTTHITKSDAYDLLVPWLGTGLLISTGSKWHKRRKILTPTFHFKILEQFVDVFNATGNILIEKLKGEVGKSSVNIYPYINHAALDVICETAMGTPINAQTSPESEYIKAVKRYLLLVMKREFSLWKVFDTLYRYSSDYREREKVLETLHGFTHGVIARRREELEQTGTGTKTNKGDYLGSPETDEDASSGYGRRKIAFLDLLLQATTDDGRPLSDEDIREEVDTFMFEGHDTVTSALSFALYEISRNPEIQSKILEEIVAITENDNRKQLTYRNLQDLKYLGLVIKETLRLYPPVPHYQRLLEEDVKIGKYYFPKGTSLIFNAYTVQRLPEYFPQPEVFDPERFTTKNMTGKNPFTFIPFSAGPRNCIGQKFAVLEMKATIAKILMNFKLLPTKPVHQLYVYSDSILKSWNGIFIRLEHRKTQMERVHDDYK